MTATMRKTGKRQIRAMKEKIISNSLFHIRHHGVSPMFFISITGIFPRKEISVLILVVSKELAI